MKKEIKFGEKIDINNGLLKLPMLKEERIGIVSANNWGKDTTKTMIGLFKHQEDEEVALNINNEFISIEFQKNEINIDIKINKKIENVKLLFPDKENKDKNIVKVYWLKKLIKTYDEEIKESSKQKKYNILLSMNEKFEILIFDEFIRGSYIKDARNIMNHIYNILLENKLNLIIVTNNIEYLRFLTDKIIIIDEKNNENFVYSTNEIENDWNGKFDEFLDLATQSFKKIDEKYEEDIIINESSNN